MKFVMILIIGLEWSIMGEVYSQCLLSDVFIKCGLL